MKINSTMFSTEIMTEKHCICLIVVIVISIGHSKCDVDDLEPGQCISKFDYDYKVMQKLFYLEREIEELKKQKTLAGIKQVAFMAELSKEIVDPPAGTRVPFDKVLTNVGGGYKSGPGVFISPVDGTYCFNVVASSGSKPASSNLHLYIMHNSVKVGYIFLDSNNDRWLQRSTTIVLEMKNGDSLYVIIGKRIGSGTLHGCCLHTHFSGFLIN